MARPDGRRWWSRHAPQPRTPEPRATGRWWVERGERWVLRPGTPADARPAVMECDAAGSLTVRTPGGRLRARVVGDPVRAPGEAMRRWREALGSPDDDALRVVDPRGAVLAAVRPLPEGGTGHAVVEPFPRCAQARRSSAEIGAAEMAQMGASGPWILRDRTIDSTTHSELVDRDGRALITDSFSRADDPPTRNGRTPTWEIRLDCASLPVSWAFGLLVAGEILRSRSIRNRLPGM